MTDQPKDTRLWCLHHIGPDDMHPAPDFATAQKWADYSNRAFAKYADISRFVVALWPWAAATHAEGLEQSIKDWALPIADEPVAAMREAIAQAVLKGIYGQAWDAFQFPEGWDWGEKIADIVLDAIRALPIPEAGAFQDRVQPWMIECFSKEIADDKLERSDRAVEEMLELSQAVCAMIGVDFAPRAHALVDYVAGRPVGEVGQEVGGVMVTLAALCLAVGENMHAAGEAELARISQPHVIQKIRAKQAAKPTGSALPVAAPQTQRAVEAATVKQSLTSHALVDFLDMRRPIKGIEYRSAEEVFAIMADRIRLAEGGHYRLPDAAPAGEGER